MALLPSITPAQVPMRISFDFFFDRAGVAAGLSEMKRRGLWRAGSVVMQLARRSIQKKGMARPKLKEMKENPNLSLRQLHNLKGISAATQRKIQQRIFEVKYRPPSLAGTPPNTHLGTLRNSIVYAFDPTRESVVVGGFMPGIERIVSLHEYGGIQRMAAWAWIPKDGGKGYTGIIGWWPVGRQPQLRRSRWSLMGSQQGESRIGGGPLGQWQKNFRYPARPYMRPALKKGVASGRIAREFARNVSFVGPG